ncbi:MAG TPA: lamin tail domain-containing protein [Ardenticatenaceae bacterium]|nr:lamin tail domain-containing protein [Ardenticatenaceae bacterium]
MRKQRFVAVALLLLVPSVLLLACQGNPPSASQPTGIGNYRPATSPPRSTATPQDLAEPPAAAPVAATVWPLPAGEPRLVERIVDGDTVELDDGETVRMLGINTPERDQPFYNEATSFTSELLLDQEILVETDVEPQDRYGRTLGYLFLTDGTFANIEIVRNGYAPVWTIEPNSRYRDEFAQAEAEAQAVGRGIWAASTAPLRITDLQSDPPGRDDDDLNAETVSITNEGQASVGLAGFRLSDRANTTYIFPDVSLAPGKTVVLHAGSGRDGDSDLYWGLSQPVWNNKGDTAFLRDTSGNSVDVYSYGEDAP